MLLTNPTGIVVKPQGACNSTLADVRDGGPVPSRALPPHKAVRREREEE
jgi:hypothetical protein